MTWIWALMVGACLAHWDPKKSQVWGGWGWVPPRYGRHYSTTGGLVSCKPKAERFLERFTRHSLDFKDSSCQIQLYLTDILGLTQSIRAFVLKKKGQFYKNVHILEASKKNLRDVNNLKSQICSLLR